MNKTVKIVNRNVFRRYRFTLLKQWFQMREDKQDNNIGGAIMKELEIGKSGIKVPFLGLGTWAIGGGSWWGDNEEQESIYTIQEAIDSGIRWIDTAPVYGLGYSEKVVGRALEGRRDKVVLSTKCALEWDHETPCFHKEVDGTKVYRDLSKKSIMEDVDRSLINLKTDYIDICYTHWQSPDRALYPLEETMDALMTLKKQGKIRAIGASNVTAQDIEEYCSFGQLDVIQEKYSILTRRVEEELAPACRKYGVSIQAYSPLEQGLLTGKVTMDTELSPGDVRNYNIWWEPGNRLKVLNMLEGWKPYCEKYNCTPGNLTIALTSEMLDGVHVLCGARKIVQVQDNVKAMKLVLEAEDIEQMKADISRVLQD